MQNFDTLRTALGFETEQDKQDRIAARIERDRAAERERIARIEAENAQTAADVRRAANLRKTAHLNRRKAGTGPRIAR